MPRELVTWVLDIDGNAKREADGLSKSIGPSGLVAAASAGAAAVAGIAAVVAGAGVAFKALADDVYGTVDSMNTLAQGSGLAIETVNALRVAARAAGKDLSDIMPTQLAERMLQTQQGLKRASRGFEQLGIDVEDSSGNLRSADAVLREVIDRLQQIEDPTRRAAIASQLLGEQGRQLLTAFSDSSALDHFVETTQRYGIDVGPDAVEATNNWLKATSDLTLAWETLQQSILDVTGGPAGDFLRFLTEMAITASVALERPGDVLSGMFTGSDIRDIQAVREELDRFFNGAEAGFNMLAGVSDGAFDFLSAGAGGSTSIPLLPGRSRAAGGGTTSGPPEMVDGRLVGPGQTPDGFTVNDGDLSDFRRAIVEGLADPLEEGLARGLSDGMRNLQSLAPAIAGGDLGGVVNQAGGIAAGAAGGPIGILITALAQLFQQTETFAKAQARVNEGLDGMAELLDAVLEPLEPLRVVGHELAGGLGDLLGVVVELAARFSILSNLVKIFDKADPEKRQDRLNRIREANPVSGLNTTGFSSAFQVLHDGIERVPSTAPYFLQEGERVISTNDAFRDRTGLRGAGRQGGNTFNITMQANTPQELVNNVQRSLGGYGMNLDLAPLVAG